MPFTERAFRDALGRFATGIVVVTAKPGSVALGLTVNSFNSVSLQPPLVLFSLAKRILSFAAWQSVEHYAINVLTERQEKLSARFATALTDKWGGIETVITDQGVPIIRDALVSFICAEPVRIDGGDHQIMIGRVINICKLSLADQPLIFYRGRYRKLDPEPCEVDPEGLMIFQGW